MMRQTLSASPLTFRRSLLVAGPGSNLTLETSEPQKTRSIAPTTLVYWTRLGFAVLAGALYNALDLRGLSLPRQVCFALRSNGVKGPKQAHYTGNWQLHHLVLVHNDPAEHNH